MKKISFLTPLSLALMLATTATVNAAVIFSDSFESPVTTNPNPLDAPADWDYTRGNTGVNGIYNETASTPYGDQFLRVFSGGGGWDMVTTSSQLNHTIVLGEQYDLSLNYGSIVTNRSGNFLVELVAIDGLANQTVLASDFRTWDATAAAGFGGAATQDFSLSYTAVSNAGERLGIRITDYASVTAHGTIDNIQLSLTPIPEPSAFALAGLAGMALLVRRRR